MNPGPELDLMINARFMYQPTGVPLQYSTDIAAAFKLVNAINSHGFRLYWEDDCGWTAWFSFWDSDKTDMIYYTAVGDSAPHAICLAALETTISLKGTLMFNFNKFGQTNE